MQYNANQALQDDEAVPHRLLLVADPQLVDPHTYPGRPWPLSSLTVYYTDLYLRKSFSLLLEDLKPDTTFFLGDLFDGGREWSTPHGKKRVTYSEDKRWRRYGRKFWLKEYYRFSRIFIDPWIHSQPSRRLSRQERKLITSLPGNHDLGFGNGIRLPVRQRFNAYFGDGNRIDIIGNHSVVSLDTVSLSAREQANADAQHPAASDEKAMHTIWQPTQDFLAEARTLKARATKRELDCMFGKQENDLHLHNVQDIVDSRAHAETILNRGDTLQLPTIVLSHVPLYRDQGTPCGPLRERYPPSQGARQGSDGKVKDDANAIRVAGGFQYQNVLMPAISDQIVEDVGNVEHVFSGDDHDYCDVLHRGYTSRSGGVREITVKSMSWAMGVRKPGVLLVSLWNPVDDQGVTIKNSKTSGQSKAGKQANGTIQTQLCLLPDQLSIFLKYAWLLLATLFVSLVEALVITLHVHESDYMAKNQSSPNREQPDPTAASASAWSTRQGDIVRSETPVFTTSNGLSSRMSGRSRASSTLRGYGIPLLDGDDPQREKEASQSMMIPRPENAKPFLGLLDLRRLRGSRNMMRTWSAFLYNLKVISSVVLPYYIWLIWHS